jgi:SAM-dependent methyltransferase
VTAPYRLLYRIGFTPWERMASLPIADQIAALIACEERGEPPHGSALDLGCGSGIWAVELARRGWEVTGVDIAPGAIRRARRRTLDAGVGVRLVVGDVTRLAAADVGSGFRFLIDLGCLHHVLSRAVGREVCAVAAPDAALLTAAWAPGRRLGPRGASRADYEAALPGWSVTDEQAADVSGAPRSVRRAAPRFYRLRREP